MISLDLGLLQYLKGRRGISVLLHISQMPPHLQTLLGVDYESLGNHKLSAHFGEQENISACFFGNSFTVCDIGESPGAVPGCVRDTRHLRGKKNEPLVFSPENYISCSTAVVEQNKQSGIERGNSSRHVLRSILYINVMSRLEVVTDLLRA